MLLCLRIYAFKLCFLLLDNFFVALNIYFWHFTNPKHIEETGHIIPIFLGIRRVSDGGTVLHRHYIIGLPDIPEAERK